jgi:hypothetical protein
MRGRSSCRADGTLLLREAEWSGLTSPLPFPRCCPQSWLRSSGSQDQVTVSSWQPWVWQKDLCVPTPKASGTTPLPTRRESRSLFLPGASLLTLHVLGHSPIRPNCPRSSHPASRCFSTDSWFRPQVSKDGQTSLKMLCSVIGSVLLITPQSCFADEKRVAQKDKVTYPKSHD